MDEFTQEEANENPEEQDMEEQVQAEGVEVEPVQTEQAQEEKNQEELEPTDEASEESALEVEEVSAEEKFSKWLESPLLNTLSLNWTKLIFVGIILLAIFTRFYDLESRVMSHDENSHVYFSWQLYRGNNYAHDPVTHGPFQFHAVALSYFLFGDNDLTARIPSVVFGIAAVAFLWAYKRYLGKTGTLIAAALFVISPFLLYYDRYVRNESFVVLFGLVALWAALRYMDTGKPQFLYYLSAATALHFTTKETSFIYTAQLLLFLGFLFICRVNKLPWKNPGNRHLFNVFLIAAAIFLLIAIGVNQIVTPDVAIPEPTVTTETGEEAAGAGLPAISPMVLLFMGLGGLSFLIGFGIMLYGFGFQALRKERSFGLMLLLLTLVLPSLAAFPMFVSGLDPTDYYTREGVLRIIAFLIPMAAIAIAAGLWWNPRQWVINNAIFYIIFVLFFTTFFTNGNGLLTGLMGSLGYWLEQQGVERGSQPLYYYALVQIPVYEFLGALGTLLAGGMGLGWLFKKRPQKVEMIEDAESGELSARASKLQAALLLIFWAVSSLAAYSYAGEKMPWLTVHIAWPMLLVTGWVLGKLFDQIKWKHFFQRKGVLGAALVVLLLVCSAIAVGLAMTEANPETGSLDVNFWVALSASALSAAALIFVVWSWKFQDFLRVATLVIFTGLTVLTARASFRAAYINYDYPTEYLVYAHSADGIKVILSQIEEISARVTDGNDLVIAYDNETTYPYWWYLRDYHNQRYYAADPTRDLRNAPVIMVGQANFAKLEPIVGQAYERFDYNRIWWPNQDYFDNFSYIRSYLSDPATRQEMWLALFDIWFNRDYTKYGRVTGKDFSLPNWSPADRMRLYIRKDIAAQLWDHGTAPVAAEVIADPYEDKGISLQPDFIIGASGTENGFFNAPRDLAIAPDGSLYVADWRNNRIQHFDAEGNFLDAFGTFGSAEQAPSDTDTAGNGQFYEPWGLAVAAGGSIFVADTWNHRIQKFSPEGEFIASWGYFNQSTDDPFAMWGPRDVAIDSNGNVLVTDTGNKRVLVYDQQGNYLTQFGGQGFSPGEFDEPVGLAVDPDTGMIYVADTWNQRIQAFQVDENNIYAPVNAWDINGWYGQSLDNKPYLEARNGQVFIVDPEYPRILAFTGDGQFNYYWGEDVAGLGIASGVAVDPDGGVWVSDGANSQILHFTLP
ncbi:MAG: TIGR03663 family protein [Anaerolineales bacterium]|nr:TIGR03663 family protein [Anaerolineales bacterium]